MAERKRIKTVSEAWLREQAAAGRTWADVAKELNAPPTAVYQTAALLGIPSAYHTRGGGKAAERYLAAMERGLTPAEVAREFGVSRAAVAKSLRDAGLPTTLTKLFKAKVAAQQPAAQLG